MINIDASLCKKLKPCVTKLAEVLRVFRVSKQEAISLLITNHSF